MSEATVNVGFTFRWWVLPYLRLMHHLHHQFGMPLKIERLHARVLKGTVVVVNGKRAPLRP